MNRKLLVLVVCILAFFAIDYCVSAFLRKGLDNYFGLSINSEILLIGHSHLMLATDKCMIEDSLGCKVSKYCREGVDVKTRQIMLQHYLSLPDKDSLKVVMYGVDQYMFNPTGLSDNVYKLFYPFMDNESIDYYIYENTDAKDYWSHKVIKTNGYTDALINSAFRGWTNNWDNYKKGTIDMEIIRNGVSGKQLRPIIIDSELKIAFEQTLSMLTDRGINIVLLNTPIIKEYNEFETEKRSEIIEYFHSLDESSDLIYYWDLNPEYSERYDLFFDPIHINNTGQPIITEEIIKLYKSHFQ